MKKWKQNLLVRFRFRFFSFFVIVYSIFLFQGHEGGYKRLHGFIVARKASFYYSQSRNSIHLKVQLNFCFLNLFILFILGT